jgi:hypothetical protein
MGSRSLVGEPLARGPQHSCRHVETARAARFAHSLGQGDESLAGAGPDLQNAFSEMESEQLDPSLLCTLFRGVGDPAVGAAEPVVVARGPTGRTRFTSHTNTMPGR